MSKLSHRAPPRQIHHAAPTDPLGATAYAAARAAIRDAAEAGEIAGGQTIPRRAYSIAEAAHSIGVSDGTLRGHIRRGMPVLRLGAATVRIEIDAAIQWLREHPAPERDEGDDERS